MPFKVDPDQFVLRPLREHPPQCRKQYIIHLRVVDLWDSLQQLLCLLFPQPYCNGLLSPNRIFVSGRILGQTMDLLIAFSDPVIQLRFGFTSLRVVLQALRPLLKRSCLHSKQDRLAAHHLLIPKLQVFQQNPPRHAVHYQMVHDQQKPLPSCCAEIIFHRPDEAAAP